MKSGCQQLLSGCGLLVIIMVAAIVSLKVVVALSGPSRLPVSLTAPAAMPVADVTATPAASANPTARTSAAAPTATPAASPLATPTLAARREALRAEYERFIQTEESHLNYIQAKLRKGPHGTVNLMAVHTYFSRYTLDIGSTAPAITGWIDRHVDDLKAAKIQRVGVASTDDFSGESSYNLDKWH